jgi:DNA-directed RNA polymerase specialized sigma24 family protein
MPDLVEERSLTPVAFTRLLEWLDEGRDSRGERYLEIRRRLVAYFDRRNRPFADDLADETLNRVGCTLEQSGYIAVKPPARYCYVVARFVLLEDIRRGRRSVSLAEQRAGDRAGDRSRQGEEPSPQEQRLECLDRCLSHLRPEQRQLAIEYYRASKREKIARRRDLASRLGITMNALGIRAYRIRAALETCVGGCCGG